MQSTLSILVQFYRGQCETGSSEIDFQMIKKNYAFPANHFCSEIFQRVIFNIVNISKNRNLFKYGLTPLVKSSGRPKWQRLPKNHVFYYRSPVHQNHYVLSFAFAFEKEDEVYQFAVAPPYSFSRLHAYLNAIENKYRDTFLRETIGKSLVTSSNRQKIISSNH